MLLNPSFVFCATDMCLVGYWKYWTILTTPSKGGLCFYLLLFYGCSNPVLWRIVYWPVLHCVIVLCSYCGESVLYCVFIGHCLHVLVVFNVHPFIFSVVFVLMLNTWLQSDFLLLHLLYNLIFTTGCICITKHMANKYLDIKYHNSKKKTWQVCLSWSEIDHFWSLHRIQLKTWGVSCKWELLEENLQMFELTESVQYSNINTHSL